MNFISQKCYTNESMTILCAHCLCAITSRVEWITKNWWASSAIFTKTVVILFCNCDSLEKMCQFWPPLKIHKSTVGTALKVIFQKHCYPTYCFIQSQPNIQIHISWGHSISMKDLQVCGLIFWKSNSTGYSGNKTNICVWLHILSKVLRVKIAEKSLFGKFWHFFECHVKEY